MSSDTVQVIGAGYGRTGTMTLKTALEILGYPCYHMVENFNHGHSSFWIKVADKGDYHFDEVFRLPKKTFTATCDFPSSQYWQEQLAQYPNAKVILTARDAEKWYQSASSTIFHMMPTSPSCPLGVKVCLFLGLPTPRMGEMVTKVVARDAFHHDWSKENIIRSYNEHNQRVIDTCPKDKLLVFEVAQGWEPLCKFLGKPVPDVPFPRVNDTEEFQQQVRFVTSVGNATLALAVMLPVAAVAWWFYGQQFERELHQVLKNSLGWEL